VENLWSWDLALILKLWGDEQRRGIIGNKHY